MTAAMLETTPFFDELIRTWDDDKTQQRLLETTRYTDIYQTGTEAFGRGRQIGKRIVLDALDRRYGTLWQDDLEYMHYREPVTVQTTEGPVEVHHSFDDVEATTYFEPELPPLDIPRTRWQRFRSAVRTFFFGA